MRLLIRILANAAAVLIAVKLVPGFNFSGSLTDLLIAGAVLGLLNGLVKPVLDLLALPVIFLTLGLFHLIINMFLLLLADKLLVQLAIKGLWALFWGAIIISIANHLASSFGKRGELNKF